VFYNIDEVLGGGIIDSAETETRAPLLR